MTVPGEGDFTTSSEDTLSVDPVDVRLVEDVTTVKQEAADYGGWAIFIASNLPQRILRRNPKRHRAIISIWTFTTGSTPPDGVLLGSENQITGSINLSPAQLIGGYLPIGVTVVLENVQELFMVQNSNNVNGVGVTVIDEIWENAG